MNKKLRIKPGWKMKCKAKKFTTIEAVGSYPIDRYKTKDEYIPDAMAIADAEMVKTKNVLKSGKANRQTYEWSLAFVLAMDDLLSKAGLRVL